MTNKITYQKSSGNIFMDLELHNAEQLQTKGTLGVYLLALLQEKKLEQYEIAELLGIKQAEVSHILNGHFSRFSIDKLLEFLKQMEQKVTIPISPHHKGEPYQYVDVGNIAS